MKQYIVNEEGERTAVVLSVDEYERRAWVIGTGLDVWEMIELYQIEGRERLLKEHPIGERQLEAALSYWREHLEEIDPAIEENAQPLEYWRERYPDLDIQVHEF